ncbi:MAG: hypothetical protein K9L86_01550 [Candidatus Omnitrophica bacterium]|nr:hypothetical protein [Candidatus Omnitrophota bacterium]
MKKNILFALLLVMVSCGPKPSQVYRIISNESSKELIVDNKVIDITELLEKDGGSNVSEFEEGPWVIAVHSEKTGYTYFYDQNNKLLGKRSEFQGNPREDLIHKRLSR